MQAIKELSKRPSFHVILTSVPQIVASLGRAVLKNDRIRIRMNAKIVKPMTEIHPEKNGKNNSKICSMVALKHLKDK